MPSSPRVPTVGTYLGYIGGGIPLSSLHSARRADRKPPLSGQTGLPGPGGVQAPCRDPTVTESGGKARQEDRQGDRRAGREVGQPMARDLETDIVVQREVFVFRESRPAG